MAQIPLVWVLPHDSASWGSAQVLPRKVLLLGLDSAFCRGFRLVILSWDSADSVRAWILSARDSVDPGSRPGCRPWQPPRLSTLAAAPFQTNSGAILEYIRRLTADNPLTTRNTWGISPRVQVCDI